MPAAVAEGCSPAPHLQSSSCCLDQHGQPRPPSQAFAYRMHPVFNFSSGQHHDAQSVRSGAADGAEHTIRGGCAGSLRAAAPTGAAHSGEALEPLGCAAKSMGIRQLPRVDVLEWLLGCGSLDFSQTGRNTIPPNPAVCPPLCSVQVITSSDLPGWQDHVTILASTTLPQAGGSPQRLRLRVPRVHAYFTGTGECAGCTGGFASM